MATLTCSVEGCERPHEARGWCKGHYHRWQRHGDPGAEAIGQMTLGRTFWNQLDRSGDCWIWTRANIQGYGVLVAAFGAVVIAGAGAGVLIGAWT